MGRTILITSATLAILAVGSLVPHRAETMTVATPAGIKAAIEDNNLVQEIACRRIWRCGPMPAPGVASVGVAPVITGMAALLWSSVLRPVLASLSPLMVVS